MEYEINPQRLSTFTLVIITILWIELASNYGRSIWLFLIVLLIGIGLALFRFKFTIYAEHLVYQVLLFNKSIIKKEVYPNQVNELKFIRIGWAKKAAIIKMKKGLNIRLSVLESQDAYDHLIEFAEKQNIRISKTRDYQILERRKKRR